MTEEQPSNTLNSTINLDIELPKDFEVYSTRYTTVNVDVHYTYNKSKTHRRQYNTNLVITRVCLGDTVPKYSGRLQDYSRFLDIVRGTIHGRVYDELYTTLMRGIP